MLRELFAEGLAATSPDFEFVRRHQPLVGIPGERAYRRAVSPDVVQWLVLVPDAKREAFFLEVGWSRCGRFPQQTMRPSFVREAARDRVAPRVDEALAMWLELGRPFLERHTGGA